MDLKVVLLAVCLCAFAITCGQAGIPRCCISTKMSIPRRILAKIEQMEIQSSNGACDIPALILYVRNFRKPVCAHPKLMERISKYMKA